MNSSHEDQTSSPPEPQREQVTAEQPEIIFLVDECASLARLGNDPQLERLARELADIGSRWEPAPMLTPPLAWPRQRVQTRELPWMRRSGDDV